MPVHLVRTLLVREVGAVRETDGAQVVGQVGPDLAHVERFADPLEILTPQRQDGAVDALVPVGLVLRHIQRPGAVVVARAHDRARLAVRPHVLGDVLGCERLRVMAPIREEVAQPHLLPTDDERLWQVRDLVEQSTAAHSSSMYSWAGLAADSGYQSLRFVLVLDIGLKDF